MYLAYVFLPFLNKIFLVVYFFLKIQSSLYLNY